MLNTILLVYLLILQNTLAQNEIYSEGMNSSEASSSCTNTTDDDACELDTTDNILKLEEANGTTELYNTTPFSGENGMMTEVIETTSSTEMTTEPTTMTVEAVSEARLISNEPCTCDLTMDSCDINCCCDAECTVKDRMAFSGCIVRPQYNFDSRHCYQTQFIYRNNTEFKSVQSPDGLFCIVRDNLPSRFLYQNRKVVTTLHEFNKLHKKHKSFSWPFQEVDHEIFIPSRQYRAGAVIWTILTNKSFVPFSLPVSVTSSLCQTAKTMFYLQDWNGECSHSVLDGASSIEACENDPGLSAVSFYSGFTILSAPQLLNHSHFKEECPAHVCLPVTAFLCVLEECIQVSDIEYPVYNSETGVCHSVVKQVSYKVYHNGTDGITKVYLYVYLRDVALQGELSQMFSISFHWTKDADNLFHRSGNPGYIVGKPVMAGRKLTQIINTEEEIDKEAIEVGENAKDWLSIAVAMYNGECDVVGNSYRQTVTFGEDRLSSCAISVRPVNFTSSASCAAFQKTVLQVLIGGTIENVTSVKNFNLYVATFGDSKVEDTGDWVQVMLESVPSGSSSQKGDWSLTCKSLVTSVHIDIMYAHVASLAVPQAKILGVVVRFGQTHNVMYSCSSLHCVDDNHKHYVKLVSSVSFIDVTKPPIAEFAEPPVYEVKLPHDFFYPFFSNSPFLHPSSKTLALLVVLTLIHN